LIIGERFIWLHLPKTGGTSASRLFAELAIPSVVADDQSLDSKHESIEARLPDWDQGQNSKAIYITLRRLPQWLLSDWHHKKLKMGLDIPFEPVKSGLFYSLRLGGIWVAADYWMRYFHVDHCSGVIRLEHLEDDVREKIVPLLPADTPPLRFPKDNANCYSRKLSDYFRSSDIERIYATNPFWQQQELQAYGHTAARQKPLLIRKIHSLFQ
jgi:hypothetical protein